MQVIVNKRVAPGFKIQSLPPLILLHNMDSDTPKSYGTPESATEFAPKAEPQQFREPTPIIDKENLMKKLEGIPIDTLRSILMNQVDLEIRLKHKELRLTEEELGKCEAQMLAIRKFFDVPNNITFNNEPNDFTLKYYDLLNKSLSVNYTKLQQQQFHDQPTTFNENIFLEPVHSYRTRSTTSLLRPSLPGPAVRIAGCLYRRTDGIIVKLTCPDCQRSNFSSAQGFLNHSRIAHSKEYTSQDAAALRCGDILPDELQDEEGLTSLQSLKKKNMDASKNLNVNEIYFNGLSNTLNTVHRPMDTHSPGETMSGPTVPGESELMKKLIKNGVTHTASEYNDMVEEVRSSVPNSHLFDDEEEEEPKTNTTPEVSIKLSGAIKPSEIKPSAIKPSAFKPSAIKPSAIKPSELIPIKPTVHVEIESHSEPENETAHPTEGGKYENRLRRRKSRGALGSDAPRLRCKDDAGDSRPKRRKSHRKLDFGV